MTFSALPSRSPTVTSNWQSAMRRLPTGEILPVAWAGNGDHHQESGPAREGSSLRAEDSPTDATATAARRARPRVCGSRHGAVGGRPALRGVPDSPRTTGVRARPRGHLHRRRGRQSLVVAGDRHRPCSAGRARSWTRSCPARPQPRVKCAGTLLKQTTSTTSSVASVSRCSRSPHVTSSAWTTSSR